MHNKKAAGLSVNDTKICSVSEAKRMESGRIIVNGMIASISTLYMVISKSEWECSNFNCSLQGSETFTPPLLVPPQKLDNTAGFKVACFKCNSTAFNVNHTYRNARTIQLEDVDKNAEENNIDRLEVVTYDDACAHVIPGEVVNITGDLYIQRKLDGGGKGKKLASVLHSNEIKYKNKEEIVVTPRDIEIFHKHKQICNRAYARELEAVQRNEPWSKKISPMRYIDRIVAMFAPNVIGHNDKKLGLLRSLIGGRSDHGNDNGRRGRINTLMVGDPGTAKSLLAREATKIFSNSRYVTAQNASGKSLIAIVDKENDSLFLRLGAIVLAKGAICAINEIGAMSLDDQQHLIDVAEEGRCTVDKYGMHFEIDSPTTIIATANPYNATWNKGYVMSKDEIPTLKTFLDRCDQVYGSRDAPSEEEIIEYTKQKTNLRKRRPHNYNFLKKLLTYAKAINPEMTLDAEDRLNKFWIKAKHEGTATNRTYDSIFRLAEAQAKLNLSSEVSDEIATQTMDSIRMMLSQYGKIVETIESPKDITYRSFFYILKQTKTGLSVSELCKIACEEHKHVAEYLGYKWDMEHNHKIKPIVDMLLNYHGKNIKIVKMKPMVLQYIDDGDNSVYDVSDTTDIIRGSNVENGNTRNEKTSDMSDNHIYQQSNFDVSNITTTDVTDATDASGKNNEQNNNVKTKAMSDKSDLPESSSDYYLTSDESDSNSNSHSPIPNNNNNNNNNAITTYDVSDATDTLSQQQSEKEKSLNETMSDTPDRSDSDENVDYNKQANNQLYSILTDPSADLHHQQIFWQRFDELEKESDNKLVDHQILKESLVSSGKFYVGDAHKCIESMVRLGRIIQVGFHKYKRKIE
jgi:DNA replicative helicase MCM subunit Mcm2 (Cdc46/Mcm family)